MIDDAIIFNQTVMAALLPPISIADDNGMCTRPQPFQDHVVSEISRANKR